MKFVRKPWLWWCSGVGLGALSFIWAAYRFAWFPGKTPWDWLSLLVVPLALALVAIFFNQMNTRTERQIALDRQRGDILQAYLDRMSELLLEKGLGTPQAGAEVRNVARTRTINVLIQLDVKRVEYVFAFLREAGLIEASNPIISLKGANLSRVNWRGANIGYANLSGAELIEADLREVYLNKADLSGAKLSSANLKDAVLLGSNLSNIYAPEADFTSTAILGSNLSGAYFLDAKFIKASLIGTTSVKVNFSGAKLRKASFKEANLEETNFVSASLRGVDFTRASMSKVRLSGAKIDKSQLTPEQIKQAIWD